MLKFQLYPPLKQNWATWCGDLSVNSCDHEVMNSDQVEFFFRHGFRFFEEPRFLRYFSKLFIVKNFSYLLNVILFFLKKIQ